MIYGFLAAILIALLSILWTLEGIENQVKRVLAPPELLIALRQTTEIVEEQLRIEIESNTMGRDEDGELILDPEARQDIGELRAIAAKARAAIAKAGAP
jgi:hypothetical protein